MRDDLNWHILQINRIFFSTDTTHAECIIIIIFCLFFFFYNLKSVLNGR